jgi:Cft2 family RNA processing exonuclease
VSAPVDSAGCGGFYALGVRHISSVPHTSGWERKIAEGPPCVVLASPAFLENGPSRNLLELWAPDSRNGLIIAGYSVEGTLARVSTTIAILCFILLKNSVGHHGRARRDHIGQDGSLNSSKDVDRRDIIQRAR